jgi:hypothetical protein
MTETQYNFSGVWRSNYYKADDKDDPNRVETEQYVTIRAMGNQVIVESIPGPSGSYLLGRFTIDDRVLTGSYQSQNSPNNSAKDALYYGAAQLVVDEDGQALRGMGVGFGENMEVKSTYWELMHVGQGQGHDQSQTESQLSVQ